jgi:environmental stress-induced protein Ves
VAVGSRPALVSAATISRAAYRVMPWKNGGGTTSEIAAGEGWRLSIATIDRDGWFSEFVGYDRTIVPIEGDGIELTVDGQTERLDKRFARFSFAGEAKTWCRLLGGPARDLNVMTRRDRWKHAVAICRLRERRLRLAVGPLCFAYVLDGVVLGAAAGDTIRIDGPDVLELEQTAGDATACVVSLFNAA